EDTRLDRPVAVKLIRPEHVGAPEIVARFRREARLTARLAGHPNVVILHDFGDVDGSVYAVMELVRGESLSKVLRGSGPHPVARAAAWTAQAAAGLAAAHAAGIVHRDVKPGNLMVLRDGTVKVLDFGIAGISDAAAQSRRLTRAGEVFGTPLHMSPEQIRGENVGAAGDLYSLGTILYRLLTGTPPFRDPEPMRIVRMHLVEAPRPPGELRPGLPDGLSDLVLQLLAKAPADRPATADEVRARLASYLTAPDPPRVSRPDPPLSGPSPLPTGPYPAARRPPAPVGRAPEAVPPAAPADPAPSPRRSLELRLEAAEERARSGDAAGAADDLRALLPHLAAAHGPEHPETLRARRRAAHLRGKGGDPAGAVAEFAALAADLDRVYGRRHPETLTARYYLAVNAGRTGDHARAARVHEELLPDLAAVHGPDSERVLTTRLYLAFDVGETGEPVRAAALLRALVPDLERVLGPDHATSLRARHYLAAYTGFAGDPAEAARRYQDLLADHSRLFGPAHPETRSTGERLHRWLRQAGG
uniref:serine/threonine-protein kinase n=1 Tax=Nocardiopsis trehalosi TaxID=109329 RepID=UPI00082A3D43